MMEVNKYSPFPIYDTEVIRKLKRKIDKMINDEEKVECCNGCKSLALKNDDFGNTWCQKCHTPNNIETCTNIEEYLEKYGEIWN